MKKICIMLGVLGLTASAFAANTAAISVSGSVTNPEVTIAFNSGSAWNMDEITVGEVIYASNNKTLTITAPNAQMAGQENVTITANISGEWRGISEITIVGMAGSPFSVRVTTESTLLSSSFESGVDTGTNYDFNLSIPNSVATSAGSIAGYINFTAVYNS